jgi:hypothetical protein
MSVGTRKKIVDFQRMIDDKVFLIYIRYYMKIMFIMMGIRKVERINTKIYWEIRE